MGKLEDLEARLIALVTQSGSQEEYVKFFCGFHVSGLPLRPR
jgi:hypothetical protein